MSTHEFTRFVPGTSGPGGGGYELEYHHRSTASSPASPRCSSRQMEGDGASFAVAERRCLS